MFVRWYLKAAISYDKDVRVETYPFARAAIREAFFNALVHSKWQEGNPFRSILILPMHFIRQGILRHGEEASRRLLVLVEKSGQKTRNMKLSSVI